ncbi:Upstream activation factor subunit spp27 [Paramyrothecium foliicola]|nr:Upstream activation factor subunit spp27 [Paramyrothecium foliicola]
MKTSAAAFLATSSALLAGLAGAELLWDGRFNDLSSAEDLNKWSWGNQVGPYQYYIHGSGKVQEYVELSPSHKNPADSGSRQGAKISLTNTAYWNGQNMRRTELIPQTSKPIASGKVYYHFSIKREDTNAPALTREHQIAFFESHFTELKSGWLSGAPGVEDPALRWMVGGQTKWSVEWEAGVWHNVAYEIDFAANTVGFWHSTGSAPLQRIVAPISASTSSNGADWHVGVLELPRSGYPDANEDFYFSGVYIENGSITTSLYLDHTHHFVVLPVHLVQVDGVIHHTRLVDFERPGTFDDEATHHGRSRAVGAVRRFWLDGSHVLQQPLQLLNHQRVVSPVHLKSRGEIGLGKMGGFERIQFRNEDHNGKEDDYEDGLWVLRAVAPDLTSGPCRVSQKLYPAPTGATRLCTLSLADACIGAELLRHEQSTYVVTTHSLPCGGTGWRCCYPSHARASRNICMLTYLLAAAVSSEELSQYTSIIDAILATSDLETITRKKIRQGLETALGGKDTSDQKNAIKALIEQRFDIVQAAKQEDESPPPAVDTYAVKRAANGTSDVDGTDDASASPEPAKKKAKRSQSIEDADARLAAQLQAQENSLARSRTTRGGGDRSKVVKKKKTTSTSKRQKSAKKVGAEDDSDVDASADSAPKRKAGGGFQKPFVLSATLSELCGETQLSRPQVVKKLWEHIKANDLQDPKDKRQIICDDKMQAVFKQAKVDMFRMNKDIGSHLYPVEE